MKDNIVINKIEIITRCLKRVHEDFESAKGNFLTDFMRQDAVILNLQRAIQASIDLASHVVRARGLPAPKETRDLFLALTDAKLISKKSADKMIKMIGFRNIAVHEYQKLDMKIVVSVIEKHLTDFEAFIQEILAL